MRKSMFKRAISFVLVGCMAVSVGANAFAAQKTGTKASTPTSVSTVETKAVVIPQASGKTYGPWFGNRTESFTTEGEDYAMTKITGVFIGALAEFMPVPIAKAAVAALGGAISELTALLPGDYVYGTVYKRQREVYVGGEFAYFQTEVTVKGYVHEKGVNHYVGTTTKTYEGNSPMKADS